MNPQCSNALREAGQAYPRTCRVCGLGPCRNAPAATATTTTPTPEQVAQWAREAGADVFQNYNVLLFTHETMNRLVTRAMAEQAEADAKLCEQKKQVALDAQSGRQDDPSNVMLRQIANLGCGVCANAIRANAPKVTT